MMQHTLNGTAFRVRAAVTRSFSSRATPVC